MIVYDVRLEPVGGQVMGAVPIEPVMPVLSLDVGAVG